MKLANIQVPADKIESFCRRWSVKELSLFGSILRDDFGPDSDVDVLVSLEPGQTMTLESFLDMRDELAAMFGGRDVDLVQKRLLKNPFRRHEILTTREVVYAA
jgi:predicted nucleotidyltransferase